MKKRQIKILIALFVSTLCLTALAPQAKAAQVNSGEIPVTIDLGDSITYKDKEFEIELKSENPDNPMPEGTENGIYSIYITGANTEKIPKIAYDSIGIYKYTISQKIESEHIEEYDTKVYLLEVDVTRSHFTGRLQAVSTMYVFGEPTKVAGAVFYNAPPPEPTKPTTKPTETKPIETKPEKTKVVETKPAKTGVKGASFENPRTSDETAIWPYVVLFTSGALIIVIIGLDKKKKIEKL